MAKMTEIVCAQCGKRALKYAGEIKRRMRLGYTKFYCCNSCSATASAQATRLPQISRSCQRCGAAFQTSLASKSKNKRFCSRSCASVASVTPVRLEGNRKGGYINRKNLVAAEYALKRREAWKYERVAKELSDRGRTFVFEYRLDQFVYDLYLPEQSLFVEFDAPHHKGYARQRVLDVLKDQSAAQHGFNVLRISTPANRVVDPNLLKGILQ